MNQYAGSFAQIWKRNPFLRWLIALGIIAGLAALFSALAEDVWFQEGFAWDPPIIMAIYSLSSNWLDTLMRTLTHLGSEAAILVAGGMIVWFLWLRRPLDAMTVGVSLTGGVLLNATLKMVFARPRPALFTPLVEQAGFSFPSGHVATSETVFGLLAVYLWRGGHRFWAMLAAGSVPLVAFSRVYLGVHYPSDTLASVAYTTLWLWAVIENRDRHMRPAYVNLESWAPREETPRVV